MNLRSSRKTSTAMSSRKSLMLLLGAALVAALWSFFFQASMTIVAQPLPQFSSYFMQPLFVDDAFAAVGSVSARSDVSMVLVNHHLLASQFIARVIATVATDEPVTVVLVSPDHFAGGIAPVTSVIANWLTPYGILEPASDSISTLASVGVVHLQERPFEREHGITNITMFIKKAIPYVRLVPIIVRDDATNVRIDALAQEISRIPGPMLVIGSFDFTHDATNAIARANDMRSLRILERGNVRDATDIVIDSKPGIRLLMQVAQIRTIRFSMMDMSNSAQLLHDYSRTDVTSYITGIWESK